MGFGAGCVCAGCAVDWIGVTGDVAGFNAAFLGEAGWRAVDVAVGLVFGVGGWGLVFWACLLVRAERGALGRVC